MKARIKSSSNGETVDVHCRSGRTEYFTNDGREFMHWDLEFIAKSMWNKIENKLPETNKPVIILTEHGAIFNGCYGGEHWIQMDGAQIDSSPDGTPVYSSFAGIPKGWNVMAWMEIPKFNN